MVKRNLHLF